MLAPEPRQRSLQDKLLAAIDELILAYESAAEQGPEAEAPAPEVTVAAGPFPSIDALRDFERALAGIAGVSDVRVRAFEGADRAIIDVTLGRAHGTPPAETTQ